MNLTMMEVRDLPEVTQLLRSTPFFDSFEALIQLSLALIGFYIWSLARCFIFPTNITPSGWTSLATIAIALLCFQSLLTVCLLTGLRAVETRLALLVAFWIAIFLVFVDIVPESILSHAAQHALGLLRQISPRVPDLSLPLMSSMLHGLLVALLTAFTLTMAFPALRFTQTLQQLTMGKEFERAKHWATKALIWLDYFSPLLVVLAFNPAWWSLPLKDTAACTTSEENVCVVGAGQSAQKQIQQVLQLITLAWTVFLKLLCGRRHLQAFMDVSVQAVTQVLVVKDVNQLQALRGMIEARSRYLMAAATQWMATVAVFLLSLMTYLRCVLPLLIDESYISSLGGVSSIAEQAVHGLKQLWQVNTTQIVTEEVGKPFFEEAFFTLLGAVPKELSVDTEGVAMGRGSLMQAFLVKLQQLHPLPGPIALPFMQGIIFWMASLYLALNVLALSVWVIAPTWFQKTVAAGSAGGGSEAQ